MLSVNEQIEIPDSELRFTFSRSPGPGGQNVNKVNSKATLRWAVVESPSIPDEVRRRFLEIYRTRINQLGELVMTGSRFRDAPKNSQDCLDKLRAMLLVAARRPKRRVPTRPSRGSNRRRLESKNRQSQKKQNRRPGAWD
jgi:ribosome-associated protein